MPVSTVSLPSAETLNAGKAKRVVSPSCPLTRISYREGTCPSILPSVELNEVRPHHPKSVNRAASEAAPGPEPETLAERSSQQAELASDFDCFRAIVRPELAVDVAHVGLDSVDRQDQLTG